MEIHRLWNEMLDKCWKQNRYGNSNLQTLNLEWKQDDILRNKTNLQTPNYNP